MHSNKKITKNKSIKIFTVIFSALIAVFFISSLSFATDITETNTTCKPCALGYDLAHTKTGDVCCPKTSSGISNVCANPNPSDLGYQICNTICSACATTSSSVSSPPTAQPSPTSDFLLTPIPCDKYFGGIDKIPQNGPPRSIDQNDYCAKGSYDIGNYYLPIYKCPTYSNYKLDLNKNPVQPFSTLPLVKNLYFCSSSDIVCTYKPVYHCVNNACVPGGSGPDCEQGKPCCSNSKENICSAYQTPSTSYECCPTGQCYVFAKNAESCCNGGPSKICGEAPKQVCCNDTSTTDSNPVQDCVQETGKCCDEGPYVGDDTSMTGEIVNKVCGSECCDSDEACDTKTNTCVEKPTVKCSVSCNNNSVEGIKVNVNPGANCTITATSEPSSGVTYNLTRQVLSGGKEISNDDLPDNNTIVESFTKTSYTYFYDVTATNAAGTSDTASCSVNVVPKLAIDCTTASVAMNEYIALTASIEKYSAGIPPYNYSWSGSVPENSSDNCPNSNTNTKQTISGCQGNATVTNDQKSQLCFNPKASPIFANKTVTVTDSEGNTVSAICKIKIMPQPLLKVECIPPTDLKNEVISQTEVNLKKGENPVEINGIACNPYYIIVLGIPVKVTGNVTNSKNFCSVDGDVAPNPKLNADGTISFDTSCANTTRDAQAQATFTSCFRDLSDIPDEVLSKKVSITATSDCQSGSATCDFQMPTN